MDKSPGVPFMQVATRDQLAPLLGIDPGERSAYLESIRDIHQGGTRLL